MFARADQTGYHRWLTSLTYMFTMPEPFCWHRSTRRVQRAEKASVEEGSMAGNHYGFAETTQPPFAEHVVDATSWLLRRTGPAAPHPARAPNQKGATRLRGSQARNADIELADEHHDAGPCRHRSQIAQRRASQTKQTEEITAIDITAACHHGAAENLERPHDGCASCTTRTESLRPQHSAAPRQSANRRALRKKQPTLRDIQLPLFLSILPPALPRRRPLALATPQSP